MSHNKEVCWQRDGRSGWMLVGGGEDGEESRG